MAYARRARPARNYWHAQFPRPLTVDRGRRLTTLLDASSYLDDRFPPRQRSDAVGSAADALATAAESGEAADVEFAATVLRLVLPPPAVRGYRKAA